MTSIKRVHVVFKTHLDIGFTHLAGHVAKQYMEEYIPKAIALADRMEKEGGPERFVWTTGSWLIRHYLDRASEEGKTAMERAIARGHIAWHGLPFTTHTELLDAPLFRYALSIGRELDARFGKTTIAAKMTDVPGHTLAMVPYLNEAGIRYLHLGVNPASKRPDVPPLFRWQADDGSEIIVNYAGSYGEEVRLEGLEDVLVFAHTGDNCGPPEAEEIRRQFEEYRLRYPGAEVLASTLDAFAARLAEHRGKLPVLREEIGDTWIHGAGTDPLKLAKLRALQRLRGEWLAQGRIEEGGAEDKGICEAMLLVAEHTWGLDVKKWLPDFRNYAKADFQAARAKDEMDIDDIPAKFGYIGAFAMDEFDKQSQGKFEAERGRRFYSTIERSWAEQREYLDQALKVLPPELREEALRAFAELTPVPAADNRESGTPLRIRESCRSGPYELVFAENGGLVGLTDGNGKQWIEESDPFGVYAYETFGTEDYERYFRTYMQNLPVTHPWADADFGKPGFEFVRPRPSHQVFLPMLDDLRVFRGEASDRYRLRLRMPAEAREPFGAPKELELEYEVGLRSGEIGIALQWFGKEANRLPEASWFRCGLRTDNPNLWTMEKLGMPLSPLRVAKGGNRNLHALGGGVRYEGADGCAEIETLDAALAAPGCGRLLQFDGTFASLASGWHFNLHNNIWGTNFPMWYGEDARFRFRLRLASNRR